MKKQSIVTPIILVSFLLSGCDSSSKNNGGGNAPTHLHDFSEEWSRDESYHYHECLVSGCPVKKGKEQHRFVNGVCDVCNYSDIIVEDYYVASRQGHYRIIDGQKGPVEEHYLLPYEDEKHIPIEPTCDKAGKSFKRCEICRYVLTVEIPAIGHSFEQITEVKATCEQAGSVNLKCVNCGYIETKTTEPLGHNLTVVDTGIDGVNKFKCSRNGCGATIFWLDITKASGWNKADTKMSGKVEPDNKSTWNVEGVIEDGTYDIYVEGLMTYASHGNRKWYNMSKSDLCVDGDQDANNSQGTADKTSEDDYRYFFKVNDSKIINPNVTDNWVTLGFGSQSNNDEPTFGAICRYVTISGATTFSLVHCNIGYALIISGIYLVKDY